MYVNDTTDTFCQLYVFYCCFYQIYFINFFIGKGILVDPDFYFCDNRIILIYTTTSVLSTTMPILYDYSVIDV